MGFGDGGFDAGFGVFRVMFFIVFALVIGIFIAIVIRNISTWNKNNNSPRLTVIAKIVSKRTNTSYHSHANAGGVNGAHGYSTTFSMRYYVTFQVDSGDRIELSVSGSEYGRLAEGDIGKLSFQGIRYLSFDCG